MYIKGWDGEEFNFSTETQLIHSCDICHLQDTCLCLNKDCFSVKQQFINAISNISAALLGR